MSEGCRGALRERWVKTANAFDSVDYVATEEVILIVTGREQSVKCALCFVSAKCWERCLEPTKYLLFDEITV